MAIGEPGTGKSAALRLLAERLGQLRDVTVGILTRPQASLADFYRELGHLFSVPLSPNNRWNSAKVLRQKWHNHIESSLYRPALIVDEAQEMSVAVFSELRLLMNMANDMLAAAVQQEREQIDQKLFFDVFSLDPKPAKKS